MKTIYQLLRLHDNGIALSIWKTVGYLFTGKAYVMPTNYKWCCR